MARDEPAAPARENAGTRPSGQSTFYCPTVLPAADVARVRRLCAARVPEHVRDEVRIEVEEKPQSVTIVECRPPWREDYGPEWTRSPIARLRYMRPSRLWTLYWHRHTGRWERYPLLPSTTRLAELLEEIERDPICVFWG